MNWNEWIRPEVHPMVPYAPGLRASEVRQRAGIEEVCKLSSNENPYGPFPSALDAMQAILTRLNRYPDGSARALVGALARGFDVAEESVVVGNGSNELLRLIAQVALRPGDEVVFAWPSFVVYPMACQMFGATAVKVPLNADDAHDLPAMLGAITDRTRVVFLCNPNNPTGTVVRRDEFERFIDAVPDHVLIVLDEAYFEYVTDQDSPDGMAYFSAEGRIAVLRTFSKMYSLAGIRVGYGIMPPELAAAVHKVREPFNVNSVAQIAAYHSLLDTVEVERRRSENQEQKTYLYSCFDRLGVKYAVSEANFVYLHTTKPVEVFEALLSEGVIARGFGTSPAIRLTVGSPEEVQATVAAFEAVAGRLGGL